MARVVHFEIPVEDAGRATAFYRDLFAWDIQGFGDEGYWLATTGPDEEAGIHGALIRRGEVHASPVIIVGVGSVDDTLAQAKDAGAEILLGKQAIPSVGYSAYLRDPEGNVIGVFQDDPNAT